MLLSCAATRRLYDLEFNWAGGGRQRVRRMSRERFFHVKKEE